jgi:prophage regulatory protein
MKTPAPAPTPGIDRLLPVAAVSAATSLSRAFLYDLVKDGKFPRPVKVSANRVAWLESAVAAWIAAKVADSAKGR